jgi:hypothetical protein
MAHFDGESGHRVVSEKLPFRDIGMNAKRDFVN